MKKMFKPATKQQISHYRGFTLAEILSVVVILGVVASIMIPTTIKNVKKRETLTRLKMAYSLLTDVTERSRIENGFPFDVPYVCNDKNGKPKKDPCYKSPVNNAQLFNIYFRPYLQVTKDCGTGSFVAVYEKDEDGNEIWYDQYDSDGNLKLDNNGNVVKARKHIAYTWRNPDDYNTNRCFAGPLGGIYDLNGKSYEWQTSYGDAYKVILKNGMSMAFRINSGFGGITIYVDVDGPTKGYSKLGQDTFMFTWANPTELGCWEGGCIPHQTNVPKLIPGGLWWYANPVYYLRSRNYNDIMKCREGQGSGNGFPNGGTCSVDIIKNNFDFPRNYPWNYANQVPNDDRYPAFKRPKI